MDEHVIEGLGKARVVVRDGKVVEVGEPNLDYCPIFDKHRGIKKIDKGVIAENIQFRIDDFGMCTPRRELKMKDFLSFGVSEIICTAIRQKRIDAAVLVCEGCGTLIVTDPEMVQGIGGRVSGLVSTTPIPEIIERVGRDYVLDPSTARIDQVEGVKKAIRMGFKNIAVSIINGSMAKAMKEIEKDHPGVNVYTFVVHATGISEKEADLVFQYADVSTGCASKYIRARGTREGVYRVGDSIPIFGITMRGRELIEERIRFMGKPIVPKPDAKQPDKLL
ncbi:methanogenesis marker 8 protein [Methanocella conradii]|uniref:methanogenesis marker 8 protein n=1 Tax=Methanocella conradii TaxID=1175444 RepID=UPI00157D8CB4|nr:methanogenesis marker 8 protein [Methanocella conradii]